MSEFTEDIRAIASAAHEDHQDASLRDRAAFYITSLGLVAHQFGMEAALFAVGTNAYVMAHDAPGPGIVAPLAAAAANGLFSLGVESALSAGTARSFDTFNGTTKEIADRFIIPDGAGEKTEDMLEGARHEKRSLKDKADTALVAVALGSAATVMVDYAKHPDEPTENHRRVGMRAARALAGVNAGIGLAVGAGIYASEELGTDAVYKTVETVADSPYTYMFFTGLIAARATYAAIKHGMKRRDRDQGTSDNSGEALPQ
jgi:hypothetical protein